MDKELEDFNKEMEDAFGETSSDPTVKEAHRLINETKNNKKLKVFGWVAFTISFIGIILSAWKVIWCWPVWIVANCFWIYWAIKKKEWSQIFLWTTFTLANFYGWFLWAIM